VTARPALRVETAAALAHVAPELDRPPAPQALGVALPAGEVGARPGRRAREDARRLHERADEAGEERARQVVDGRGRGAAARAAERHGRRVPPDLQPAVAAAGAPDARLLPAAGPLLAEQVAERGLAAAQAHGDGVVGDPQQRADRRVRQVVQVAVDEDVARLGGEERERAVEELQQLGPLEPRVEVDGLLARVCERQLPAPAPGRAQADVASDGGEPAVGPRGVVQLVTVPPRLEKRLLCEVLSGSRVAGDRRAEPDDPPPLRLAPERVVGQLGHLQDISRRGPKSQRRFLP
jgi:hypothetical protein